MPGLPSHVSRRCLFVALVAPTRQRQFFEQTPTVETHQDDGKVTPFFPTGSVGNFRGRYRHVGICVI